MKAQARLNTDEYEALLKRSAANPGFVPSTDGRTLDAPTIGYLTEICDGVCVSFLCRHCGFFGLNSQWVKHATRAIGRCNTCVYRYIQDVCTAL